MTPRTDQATRPNWRVELRPAVLAHADRATDYGRPDDRCGCGHTRAAHSGKAIAERDALGRPTAVWLSDPNACALMRCGCELFRGEEDR